MYELTLYINKNIRYNKICLLTILFTIIIIFSDFHIRLTKRRNFINKTEISFKFGNYSFYNSYDFPLISIILNFGKSKINFKEFEKYIISLLQQTIKDIQIYIYFYYEDAYNLGLINKFSSIDERIFLYISKNSNIVQNIFEIANKIKGKFLIIINKLINLDNEELYDFYNFTKGKINNIFELKTKSNYKLELIRVKTLQDIIDKEKKFFNLNDLLNYIKSLPKPNINYIPVALCPNDKYTPLAYTSMISILSTKNFNSYIDFYIIIPENYSKNNFLLFESLFDQFYYFNITYIIMDERYKKAFVHKYITNQAYYRISLGNLIRRLNKIIYLDADIICFSDLSNLYNLNFKGKIILGKGLSNKRNKSHINSGILLMNLKKMRRMKIEEKALKILNSGFKDTKLHDQALINRYFYNYIGFFPPEYNSYVRNYNNALKSISKSRIYDKDKLTFSLKYPVIRHYKGGKKHLNDDWFYFARKSKYFTKIDNNYSYIFNYSL